jgi:hypothetical protein
LGKTALTTGCGPELPHPLPTSNRAAMAASDPRQRTSPDDKPNHSATHGRLSRRSHQKDGKMEGR